MSADGPTEVVLVHSSDLHVDDGVTADAHGGDGTAGLALVLAAARAKVFAATKASKIFFLNGVTPDNVIDMIKEGVMIGSADQRSAEIGRKYTRREMPW